MTKLGNFSTMENDILLLQNSWQLIKDFYKQVFESEQPLNETIQKFAEDKTFLSLQYFDTKGESLIRQFFITQKIR